MDFGLFIKKMGILVKSKKQPFYSQFGEDIFVQAFFRQKRRGFYVDVGAHHPTFWSNTHALHKQGWSGVNIDLHRRNLELFNFARPHATNICVAVSDVEGELPYYEFGAVSLFNTLSREDAEKVRREWGIPYATRTIAARSLTTILATHGHANRAIDFLSVDVEGHDLAVLRSLDFSMFRPSLICVELHEADINKVIESPLYRFLAAQNYTLAWWPRPSLIFARSD